MKKFLIAIAFSVIGATSIGSAHAAPLGDFNFEYRMDGMSSLRPIQVFDDGSSTYFQFSGRGELPAMFSNTGRMLSGSFQNQFYVVKGVYPEIIIRNGRQMARVYQKNAQVGTFEDFQTAEAEREARKTVKQHNAAYDFEYEVYGIASEKPRLIYNDGQSTWVEISADAKIVSGGEVQRSGPYWRIEGVPSTIKVSVPKGRTTQTLEIAYLGKPKTAVVERQEKPVQQANPNVSAERKRSPEAAPLSALIQPSVKQGMQGSFTVEVQRQPQPVAVKLEPSAMSGDDLASPGVLAFSGRITRSTPALIRKLAGFLEENGIQSEYEVAASGKEADLLVAQLNRLGAKRLTVTGEQFSGARLITLEKIQDGDAR
jgi:hypothetical protein